jgi:hypothetical protein
LGKVDVTAKVRTINPDINSLSAQETSATKALMKFAASLIEVDVTIGCALLRKARYKAEKR